MFDTFCIKLCYMVRHLVCGFFLSRIYSHQDSGYAFTTVEKLLRSMSADFVSQLHLSTEELLKQQGFSNVFVQQLVRSALRTNYGQEEDMQAFVGSKAFICSKLFNFVPTVATLR